MQRSFMAVAIATTMFLSASARADNAFHPAVSRLIIHGARPLEGGELRTHFVPAGNLSNGVAPLGYVGIGTKPMSWLDVELDGGWAFGKAGDEPMASVRIAPASESGKLWGWSEFDFNLPSKHGYWFAQAEYKFRGDMVHAGLEGEGYGFYGDAASWSHGVGPDLLLRLGKVGVDLALHVRNLAGVIKPQVVMRCHLFLPY